MPRLRPVQREALQVLVDGQAGVVSRSQAIAHGMSVDQIRSRLDAGSWCRTDVAGVYRTVTGVVPDLSRCWVALLYAGKDAMLCRQTAAWDWTLNDDLLLPIQVMVPVSRRVQAPAKGISIHYSIHHGERRHPLRCPPVTRVDDTVLDLVDFAKRPAEVIDVVTRSCQRRLTTAARLGAAAEQRKKLAWRELLNDLLADVAVGVQSPLELGYVRDVERAHGLPCGERNAPEELTGRRVYRDVRYRAYRLVVELDGTAAHPVEARDRDDVRDNALKEHEGTTTLRYGWTAVSGRACETAEQVVRLLRNGGWTGRTRGCAPDCPLAPTNSR